MGRLKSVLRIALRCIKAVVILVTMAVVATSASLIYDFGKPLPFSGPDIFDPYRNIDSTHCWKKAVFHVHTRVEGIFNECDYWPGEVKEFLDRLGYDIVTFSNHNELTEHPSDSTLQVNVYEHGYNLFKFHKLVFGSEEVNRFDHLLPLFASQWQFQFDMLGKESDIIQFNHPLHTLSATKWAMEKLCGYDIMEIDCEGSTECEYWDWALSAGRYSFGLAGDDLHNPDDSHRVAKRCSFICSPSAEYAHVRDALLGGCYYSMRVPDYGNGDWAVKTARNHSMPFVKDIGVKGDTVYVSLSHVADSIKLFGQGHATLALVTDSDYAAYVMKGEDAYARFTVYFPTGEVLFSNPFARYDSALASTPVREGQHCVNIPLTVLYNAMLLAFMVLLVFVFYRNIIKR
jgi:hypothetical protein